MGTAAGRMGTAVGDGGRPMTSKKAAGFSSGPKPLFDPIPQGFFSSVAGRKVRFVLRQLYDSNLRSVGRPFSFCEYYYWRVVGALKQIQARICNLVGTAAMGCSVLLIDRRWWCCLWMLLVVECGVLER